MAGNFIYFKNKGSFNRTEKFLNKLLRREYLNVIEKYAQIGVAALANATPIDSGKTASSWRYDISHDRKSTVITWYNDNINDGHNIAILIQYGHGTGNGAYVKGYDYINPSIRPVFDNMRDDVWKEVTSL